MKRVSWVALGSAFIVGSAGFAPAPAEAQLAQPREFSFGKEERAALLPLQAAISANNFAAAAAALPAAQAAAKSSDARYMVAHYQLRTGIGTGNLQMQAQAIDAIIANGAPAADLPELYSNQAALAASLGDIRKAESAYTRLVEVAPSDAEAIARLAEVKNDLGKLPESIALMDRALGLRVAAGQAVPEGWYKRAVKIAYDAKAAPQSLKFARALVAAYPNEQNWRDAALVYRDLGGLAPDAQLDLFRLRRAAGALHGERDYLEFASALSTAGLALEAKEVLDEGVSKRMVDPGKATFKELITQLSRRAASDRSGMKAAETKALAAATGTLALTSADTAFGAGDHGKAADLYAAALQKGGVDAALVNSRLGATLALAGRRAEAETALRSVTGPRAELAALWLTWLARRT